MSNTPRTYSEAYEALREAVIRERLARRIGGPIVQETFNTVSDLLDFEPDFPVVPLVPLPDEDGDTEDEGGEELKAE